MQAVQQTFHGELGYSQKGRELPFTGVFHNNGMYREVAMLDIIAGFLLEQINFDFICM